MARAAVPFLCTGKPVLCDCTPISTAFTWAYRTGPIESENIGRSLEELHDQAGKQGLTCQILACNRSATARGYSTWDDGEGIIVSICTIKPFKIRDLNVMIDRFEKSHIILSENSGSIQFPWKGSAPSFDRADQNTTAPPVIILITRSPIARSTPMGRSRLPGMRPPGDPHAGGLSGRWRLRADGKPEVLPDSVGFNIQDLINAAAGNENLHLFALSPSFQKRGVTRNKNLKAVLEIGYPGLGKILFYLRGMC